MIAILTKEDCIKLMQNKAANLDRQLKKSDFTVNEVARIKAFFGPWPRALEAAGLKELKIDDRQKKK